MCTQTEICCVYCPSGLILGGHENNDKEGANEVYNLRRGSPLILLQFSPDHKASLSITVGRHFLDIADREKALE